MDFDESEEISINMDYEGTQLPWKIPLQRKNNTCKIHYLIWYSRSKQFDTIFSKCKCLLRGATNENTRAPTTGNPEMQIPRLSAGNPEIQIQGTLCWEPRDPNTRDSLLRTQRCKYHSPLYREFPLQSLEQVKIWLWMPNLLPKILPV